MRMWSFSKRPPDSREEDAWLNDEQMRHVAPAENEPFQSPVPTRMVSNGEYMPYPQTEQQRHVEYRVRELADEAAKRLGQSRRQFLMGSGGLAAAFIAMNEVHGKTFNVQPVEMYEPAAYAENGLPKDLFVFDDQTHIVRTSMNSPQGLRALAQGPGPASAAAGFTSNPFNGRGGNAAGPDEFGNPWPDWNPAELHPDFPPNPGAPTTALGEFHLGEYINRMYLESQVSASIISNANLGLFTPPGGGFPARRPTSPTAWSARSLPAGRPRSAGTSSTTWRARAGPSRTHRSTRGQGTWPTRRSATIRSGRSSSASPTLGRATA